MTGEEAYWAGLGPEDCWEDTVTDLTKLTAEDLLSVWPLEDDEIAEIRRRLERLESAERTIEQEQAISVGLQKRPEKCEAAIEMYLLDHAQKQAGIWPSCRCTACDAARAAVEGKYERTTRTT